MKKRYNLIVREYNKMDISKIEEYTIQVETDEKNARIYDTALCRKKGRK